MKKCHLLSLETFNILDINRHLSVVEVYEEDKYLFRYLRKCKDCGQLFLFEFYKVFEPETEQESQYARWIPVENPEQAKELTQLTVFDTASHPSLQSYLEPERKQWLSSNTLGKCAD